jgi:hypothetical protein
MMLTEDVVAKLKDAWIGYTDIVDTYHSHRIKNTVDVFILSDLSDKTLETWLAILRKESGCEVCYSSGVGRFAILCKEEDEPKVREAIEKTLPGLRRHYEEVEGPSQRCWGEDRKLSGCWYVTDRGFYRRVSAVASAYDVDEAFKRLDIPSPDHTSWDSCQRGHAIAVLQTYTSAKEWGAHPLDGATPVVIVPEFMADCSKLVALAETYNNRERRRDNRINRTAYLVEATSNEAHWLWRDHSHQATRSLHSSTPKDFPYEDCKVKWQQDVGIFQQIGTLDGMPVTISITWNEIDGHLIGFWETTSQVTDHRMIDKWLEETFPGVPTTAADTFHRVITFVRENLKVDESVLK